jgi:hypothetical protein
MLLAGLHRVRSLSLGMVKNCSFSSSSRLSLRSTYLRYPMNTPCFFTGVNQAGVTLTNNLHLVPWSIKFESAYLLRHKSSWCSAYELNPTMAFTFCVAQGEANVQVFPLYDRLLDLP